MDRGKGTVRVEGAGGSRGASRESRCLVEVWQARQTGDVTRWDGGGWWLAARREQGRAQSGEKAALSDDFAANGPQLVEDQCEKEARATS